MALRASGFARHAPVCSGPRVRLISVGKNKEKWLEQAIDIYVRRLRPILTLECQWVRDDVALEASWRRALEREPCIVLDERGAQYSSVEFQQVLYQKIDDGGSRLSF